MRRLIKATLFEYTACPVVARKCQGGRCPAFIIANPNDMPGDRMFYCAMVPDDEVPKALDNIEAKLDEVVGAIRAIG